MAPKCGSKKTKCEGRESSPKKKGKGDCLPKSDPGTPLSPCAARKQQRSVACSSARPSSKPCTPSSKSSSICVKSQIHEEIHTIQSFTVTIPLLVDTQSVGTQTQDRVLEDSSAQTEDVEDSPSQMCSTPCQTELLLCINAITQTTIETRDAETEMPTIETMDACLQANRIIGGPDHYLQQLLELSPDKMFTIQLATRKVQVVLQGGRVVVRTGGGFLKLDDFLAKYGNSSAANTLSPGTDGNVGTVVRTSSGIKLTGFQ